MLKRETQKLIGGMARRLRHIGDASDEALAAKAESLGLDHFESLSECVVRQHAMVVRFAQQGLPPAAWRDLTFCTGKHCAMDACVEACHFGTLHRRLAALGTGLPILENHPGPQYAVCLVHPLWEAPVGQLADIGMAAAAQWNYRRLSILPIAGLVAIGSFEVSLNRQQDGELYWSGEIQQIVAGAAKPELNKAFKIQKYHRQLRPHQHMVDVRRFDNLTHKFAYSQKRLVEERRAYTSKTNGRQNRNHLPLRPEHQAEHDAWLLSLPLGARAITFGCSRRGTTFFPAGSPNTSQV